MEKLLAQTFDARGAKLQEFTIEDDLDEGADFYAHQLLHVDGVVCVEIFGDVEVNGTPGWMTVTRRCDEGVVFEETVVAPAR